MEGDSSALSFRPAWSGGLVPLGRTGLRDRLELL